jgi:hypothetical protein
MRLDGAALGVVDRHPVGHRLPDGLQARQPGAPLAQWLYNTVPRRSNSDIAAMF